jgi:hypothetical protein
MGELKPELHGPIHISAIWKSYIMHFTFNNKLHRVGHEQHCILPIPILCYVFYIATVSA